MELRESDREDRKLRLAAGDKRRGSYFGLAISVILIGAGLYVVIQGFPLSGAMITASGLALTQLARIFVMGRDGHRAADGGQGDQAPTGQ